MKTESTHTRLESMLERAFELNHRKIQITGTSSLLAVAYFLSQSNSSKINSLPHLVVVAGHAQAQRFQQLVEFFDSSRSVTLLPHFDVLPYSGLHANSRLLADRLQFLVQAQAAKPGQIFVASTSALSQKTIPYKVLADHTKTYKPNDDFPEKLAEHLQLLGYEAAPVVEDKGQFSIRGGIVDIFSASESAPARFELFGDTIESIRHFNPTNQRSTEETRSYNISPAREHLFLEQNFEKLVANFRKSIEGRSVERADFEETVRALVMKNQFPGIEFLLPMFYPKLDLPTDHFSSAVNLWFVNPVDLAREADELFAELKSEHASSESALIHPPIESLYQSFDRIEFPEDSRHVYFSSLEFLDDELKSDLKIEYRTVSVHDFSNISVGMSVGSEPWVEAVSAKIKKWKEDGNRVLVAVRNQSQQDRLTFLIEKLELQSTKVGDDDFSMDTWLNEQDRNHKLLHLIPRHLGESLRLDEERLIFLREEDFLGKKERMRAVSASDEFERQARRLSFGDLKPGDLVVHVKHGVGVYEGLKLMPIGGVDSEFIQVGFKDKDKLYLPVYRIGQLQKYSGAATTTVLDKLGGQAWEKTKIKVKGHLRDLAHDLLALYAKRAEVQRPPFKIDTKEIEQFDDSFPYEETDDQLRALRDIMKDLSGTQPMDRLVCGDVGFGKTEVAMRAAFMAVQNRKQVAVLAPTTVLTSQHLETFKKRFRDWPVDIRLLNRFVPPAEAKKTLQDLKDGKVDIIIGTHRLLGKEIGFKDLGLLIIDEEQKFGVAHKEKIKRLRVSVDTVALSATPIPRTLNMSLVGVRDLSIINTAPVDRLPTRTFISKWDDEVIRKAITAEIARGGQVFFIHNRVQSIYGIADEVRRVAPEARVRVAHGQMEEHELEKTMLEFFHHEVDVLVATAIVESGVDVPRANTMFIESAQLFGLSQLYQLRGRVGRSKARAYCYLLMPKDRKLDKTQQERLKILQENTALGSGIKIAQYDLELRGAGNILGEDQSGHVNTVGYELYMDLLHEALAEAKGEPIDDIDLDPEINLRIAAMIPDKYIPDIRVRLSFYKAMAEIQSSEDLDQIESELRDQFGEIPEPTVNLMGLMLIRRQCKDLGVRDISAGVKAVSLVFTEKTKIKPEVVIGLATRENKKYAVTPDNRLNIRMNNITWSAVYEELNYLLKLI